MDGNLICAREPLSHSLMPDATKYLIIHSRRKDAKKLLIHFMVKNAHHKCMHLGTEIVRHCLQQSFTKLGLRKALRHIRHHCFLCRRFQGKGLNPFMADFR